MNTISKNTYPYNELLFPYVVIVFVPEDLLANSTFANKNKFRLDGM